MILLGYYCLQLSDWQTNRTHGMELANAFKNIFDYQKNKLAYARIAFEYGFSFEDCMDHGKEILEQIKADMEVNDE